MNPTTKSNLLSVAAGIGVAVTGYFSYKAGKSEEKGWRKFIAPVLSGAATIGCIIASNRVSAGAYAGLVATTGYLAAHRNDLKKKVEPDPEHEWDFLELPPAAEETGNGHILCLEGYSGRWFYSEPDVVDDALIKFNHVYEANGHYASMNDLYECLDIQETHFGYDFGWSGENTGSPDYITFETNFVELKGVPVYVIDLAPSCYPWEGFYEI